MKKREFFIEIICILFIILFTYAAASKLIDYSSFTLQLSKSPLLPGIAGIISWFIPLIEIVISLILVFPKTRLLGLYASYTLMLLFTAYIISILEFSEYVPCSCGGILQKLSWGPHLIFNVTFCMLAITGIILNDSMSERNAQFTSLESDPNIKTYRLGKVKSVKLLLSGFFFSVGTVFVLFILTYDGRNKYSSFQRVFAKAEVKPKGSLDLKYNSYYFAGFDDRVIYLGNETAPLHLLAVNPSLTDSHHITLSVKQDSALRKTYVRIRPPYFFMMDGVSPKILRGKLNDWSAEPLHISTSHFNESVPIGAQSFVMRVLDENTREYELEKASPSPEHLLMSSDLLEKQIDGLFCVDGTLNYNAQLNKLIYVYYYRNQYIVLDTSLALIYRARTIDSISRAKIKITDIRNGNFHSLTSNALLVNKLSCTNLNFLLINSGIRSKNETEIDFKNVSAIDIYDLGKGHYVQSFYLEKFNGREAKELRILDNRLFALFDHYLIGYDVRNLLEECQQIVKQRDKDILQGL